MPDPQPLNIPLFEVRLDEDGDTASLILSGELDLANAVEVEESFERALQNGASEIVVDLTDLTFIDSTGIALFVLTKRGDDRDRLRFRPSSSAAVRRVLAISGVDTVLGLAEGSADGALS
jgi:anti-anti-sigma factor